MSHRNSNFYQVKSHQQRHATDRAEGPPEENPPQKKNFYKAPSRKNRDQRRLDSLREKKGAETMDRIAKELDKRLCFGFENYDEAALRQQIAVQPRALVEPVSTRSVGFYVQSIFIKINQTYRNIPACTVFEAYRVSLAQYSYRLLTARRTQAGSTVVDEALYQRPRLDSDQQEAIMGMRLNFAPIANIINAIGNVNFGGVDHYFRVPANPFVLPTNVTFENLRNTVQALSNYMTPQEVRLHFYLNNPLPDASLELKIIKIQDGRCV